MESRLDLLSPNLVKKLSPAAEQKLRRITVAACKIALSRTELKSSLIDQSIEALEGSQSIDRWFLRQKLESYTNQLDKLQWDLREQVDSGMETMDKYLKAFGNARTINALYFALDSDPYFAAAETIYEVYAATNDLQALEEEINRILTE
jgi:hypothetical protein